MGNRKRGRPKKVDLSGLRLTNRDYEIFKFLFDQKFASLDALYFRFFDNRKPGEPVPYQMRVARQRLGILKRCGFIQTQKVYSESKSVYLLSLEGYRVLGSKYPDLIYATHVKEVDFRNYDHDRRVNLVRIALERSGRAIGWYPERRIRIEGFKVKNAWPENLPKSIIPDGIIRTPEGKRIAIEVEASTRKKSRFRDKVFEFEDVMGRESSLLHGVLFVACSDTLGKDLSEITSRKDQFRVEPYPYFINYLKKGSNKEKKEKPEPHSDEVENVG